MRLALALFLWLAWCLGPAIPTVVAGEVIRINGSGAALDVLTLLNDAYRELRPETRLEMEKPLGSSGAIKALLAGALDLAVSSMTLTAEQVSQGARSREFGRTPLVIVTHRGVRKADISTRELEEIYAGTLRKWPDGEQLRVILRPESDTDTTILRGLSPVLDSAVSRAQHRAGMAIAITDPESNDLVARIPGGIGASALCSLLVTKPALNALSLNGVTPSVGALADGTYPLAKDLRFITKGVPSRTVAGFLEFVYSDTGRSLAGKAGVLVAPETPAGKSP